MTPPLSRILVVDDDPDILMVVRVTLESVGGFTVACCASGREAVETAPRFAPELVLLDVMMPAMDGPATLVALRALPGLEGVTAVFLTAKVQPDEVARYRGLGIADIITKPFDPMTLPGTLRRIWAEARGGNA
jgi:CheY-like chemotaxis protein